MKTKDELNVIKEEFQEINKKLAELTDEELLQVTGGSEFDKDTNSPLKKCLDQQAYIG